MESRKMNSICLRLARVSWELLLAPWRLLFAFVPPCTVAHGWIAFISSLIFISGIAYIVTKITDLKSCSTKKSQCPAELEPAVRETPMYVSLTSRSENFPAIKSGLAFPRGGKVERAEPAMASTAPTPSVNVVVDVSLMTTSIQPRMADGTRLIGRFNCHHTISDFHYWVWSKGVEMSTYPLLVCPVIVRHCPCN
ncbi:hypothetical protein TIFTF001_013991 [Ficus carica]|uniref:UBX domain-containing protein n=1 Tax=Ficus carica TaxID=3494 RepID=A0AA88AQP0_FICCA|nr:hypothetical protein TIFTF001_013991 [Ficus carica]